eukprot:22169-Lingulodinium_polyedra.AAC.1
MLKSSRTAIQKTLRAAHCAQNNTLELMIMKRASLKSTIPARWLLQYRAAGAPNWSHTHPKTHPPQR